MSTYTKKGIEPVRVKPWVGLREAVVQHGAQLPDDIRMRPPPSEPISGEICISCRTSWCFRRDEC